MKFKTAVFDLDGTLIDTLEDLKNSVNYALSKYNYPQRTYEEIKSFVGNGVARLVYLSAPDCADDKIKEDLLSIFKKHYVDNSAVYTAPYDGIKDLLAELRSAGVKTAVVTNKMQEAAQDLVNRFFGSDIDIVIGQVDGLAQKPQPDGVWKAIESLGSSLEESIYIGDSEVDCLTASNSHLPIIGCVWGFRGRQTLEECGADYIADTPSDIKKIILG